jgi:hypothetical protein
VIDAVARQRPTAGAGKRDAVAIAAEFAEPRPQHLGGLGPERHHPFLASLPQQFDVGAGGVELYLLTP